VTIGTPQEFVEGDPVGFDNIEAPFVVYDAEGNATPTDPDLVSLYFQVDHDGKRGPVNLIGPVNVLDWPGDTPFTHIGPGVFSVAVDSSGLPGRWEACLVGESPTTGNIQATSPPAFAFVAKDRPAVSGR
jgi:hypothetical protein